VIRSRGERIRLEHATARLHASLGAPDTALTMSGPIGHEAAQAIVTNAIEIAMLIARHDAFEIAERGT
jgi:hypothetical protein